MIVIKEDNDIKKKEIVHTNLRKSNIEKCKWFRLHETADVNIPLEEERNFLVYDNNNLVGGAIGYIKYNWYFLDLLYVNEDYRGKDIGTSLINRIEELSRKLKLTGVRMETLDFQALGFYQKMGYKIFGELKDCPPGTIRYFLEKTFE